MRDKVSKWLLIGLIAVSFAGRPWAQTLPASAQGCGGADVVAKQAMNGATAEDSSEIAANETLAADEMTMAHHDSGKAKSAECAKTCAAVQALGLVAMTWCPGVWPQTHVAAIEVALIGHPPKPELFPPIALI